MSKETEFVYSRKVDSSKRYHIFIKTKKISLCKKSRSATTNLKKPFDDELCLDCYGAQIDIEEIEANKADIDNNKALDKVFISSRNDNITPEEVDNITTLSNLQNAKKSIARDIAPISPQDKKQADNVQKIKEHLQVEKDTRRKKSLVDGLDARIEKNTRLLANKKILKTARQKQILQAKIKNDEREKAIAKAELTRQSVKLKAARETIPKPKSIRQRTLVPTTPFKTITLEDDYKELGIVQKNVRHIFKRSFATVTWDGEYGKCSKDYIYAKNKGKFYTYALMRKEFPLK